MKYQKDMDTFDLSDYINMTSTSPVITSSSSTPVSESSATNASLLQLLDTLYSSSQQCFTGLWDVPVVSTDPTLFDNSWVDPKMLIVPHSPQRSPTKRQQPLIVRLPRLKRHGRRTIVRPSSVFDIPKHRLIQSIITRSHSLRCRLDCLTRCEECPNLSNAPGETLSNAWTCLADQPMLFNLNN